jgi:hypothetical protein
MEIDIAQHFLVADIYMKVFNMQHNTIEGMYVDCCIKRFSTGYNQQHLQSTWDCRYRSGPGFADTIRFSEKPGSDVQKKRPVIFPERFSIAIMIAICYENPKQAPFYSCAVMCTWENTNEAREGQG